MLSEKTIHNSFLFMETDLLNEYDRLNFQNNLQFYKEGTESMIAAVINADGSMYCEMIDQTMEHLRESTTDIKETINFFEGVYNSPTLDEIPITTKVYNLSAIEKIRPQYLEQITTDMGLNIDKYLKRKISKHEIENLFLADSYLLNCKKQMARTTIPYNLNAKDLAKYDVGTICEINREFLSTTALPFLRNIPQYIKDLEITVANVTSVINRTFDDVKIYINVVDKMLKENKISLDDYRFLNKYLYKSIRTFIQATSYLSFIMIKKITIISASINRYKELHVKILNYFPEGDNLLHESVIDGTFDDFDMGALVHDILQNNNSLFRSVLRDIVNRERGDLSFCTGPSISDDHHSMIDLSINEYDYPVTPYHNAINIFKVIESGMNTIEINLKDPYIPFDEILNKSGFNVHISERFSSFINQISDTSQYDTIIATNGDIETRRQVYFMMLHELTDAEKHMDSLVEQIRKSYIAYEDLESKVGNGDSLEIANQNTLEELHVFLKAFDADYRQLVLTVMREFIARIRSIDQSIKSIDDELFKNADICGLNLEDAETDYYDFVTESMMSIQDEINQFIFESYLKEYNQVRTFYETGVRIVYEDEQNEKTVKERLQNIIQTIKDFFTKSKKQLDDIVNKQSGNRELLEFVREDLLNRSYSGITVNVVPYEKYWTNTNDIFNDITKLISNINSLNKDNIKRYNSVTNLNSYLFSFMSNNIAQTTEIKEVSEKYYKVKNANLEVMPYKGTQAKVLMSIMVDYCTAYYSTFKNDLDKNMDSLNKALSDKIASLELVVESVIYEDGEQQTNQTTTTQTQSTNQATTTQNKPNTKPSVQIDKETNTRENGKKMESNSTFQIIKWLSSSVQNYMVGVLNATRDRNYEYMKVINPLIPKAALERYQQSKSGNQPQENQTEQQTN